MTITSVGGAYSLASFATAILARKILSLTRETGLETFNFGCRLCRRMKFEKFLINTRSTVIESTDF